MKLIQQQIVRIYLHAIFRVSSQDYAFGRNVSVHPQVVVLLILIDVSNFQYLLFSSSCLTKFSDSAEVFLSDQYDDEDNSKRFNCYSGSVYCFFVLLRKAICLLAVVYLCMRCSHVPQGSYHRIYS